LSLQAEAELYISARPSICSTSLDKEATPFFPQHVVLVGDNNVGKSTILEAIDLALGPDRLSRRPKINEHDFFCGDYLSEATQSRKEVRVEVTVTGLNEDQRNRFVDYIEWWNESNNTFHDAPPIEGIDAPGVHASIRVTFIGFYAPDDDDFDGDTYFSRSMEESEEPIPFRKQDKQYCGFLYLRSLRTGSRALSLEHGSLLDVPAGGGRTHAVL
jgi:putative ATP-dependent endonuclease of OLD family